MQMQKKITLKDDGRFLAYYHFPATATAEETDVFDGIVPLNPEEEKRRREEEKGSKGQTIAQESAANTQADAASVAPTPTTGGEAHV